MPVRRDLANAIRALSMDAVQQANSGHPGMPMGMADIAEVLWNDFLVHNPQNPQWCNRDRFVLSNGHGAMLQYALLHLSGYNLPLTELKQFRQLHSATPGHPEYGYTPGVETTTGPLGQGLANGVGMAIGERALAAQYNREHFPVIDHYTYVFAGDGCLMEGISHEACSLAGTLGLGKLIVFYDDNGISIDGDVTGWFTDDTVQRFQAYGWQVITNVDGHDSDAIHQAIEQARCQAEQPTLICCKTIIGFGSPNLAGSEKTHGAPLGDAEIAAARQQLGWTHSPFEIPSAIYSAWDAKETGNVTEQAWQALWEDYQQQFPELANELGRRLQGKLPDQWSATADAFIQQCAQQEQNLATRKASQHCLNAYGAILPELIGGSADLTGSNNTNQTHCQVISKQQPAGNYLHYGVREFAMSAIMNGLAQYGGFIPYGGTFLVFADYARNAVRLAALMQKRVIFVYTHDSIGLGEDGPTHQPIEHAAMLRLTPNMSVWRPADQVETAVAWRAAIERTQGPTSLLLSRQTLPHQSRSTEQVANIARGGYILRDSDHPQAILIATGSEVELAVIAYEQLAQQGIAVRVVSMPSTDVFDAQPLDYRQQVLPSTITQRVAIEASAQDYWYKYVGLDGQVIGLHQFGESAPYQDLLEHFGLTVDAIVTAVHACL
ncbi:MAG: transketolase [Legionellales bacterium]|nr:transketolase [Legionellales bacterium]